MGRCFIRPNCFSMTPGKKSALLLALVGMAINGYSVWFLSTRTADWGMISDLFIATLPYWIVVVLIFVGSGSEKMYWVLCGLLTIMIIAGGVGLQYIFDFSIEYPKSRYYPGKIITSFVTTMIESFSLVIMIMFAYGAQTIASVLALGVAAWFRYRINKTEN